MGWYLQNLALTVAGGCTASIRQQQSVLIHPVLAWFAQSQTCQLQRLNSADCFHKSRPSSSSKFTDVVGRRTAEGLLFLSTELQLINVLKESHGREAARAGLQAHPPSHLRFFQILSFQQAPSRVPSLLLAAVRTQKKPKNYVFSMWYITQRLLLL